MANRFTGGRRPHQKNRLRQARLTDITHLSGLLSPDVNQQIVTDHPAAFSQVADITVPRPPAGLWPVPLTTAHVRSSDFVQSTAQYCQVRIRTASPGSLSVQESRFVNFVGVRVKARP